MTFGVRFRTKISFVFHGHLGCFLEAILGPFWEATSSQKIVEFRHDSRGDFPSQLGRHLRSSGELQGTPKLQ